MSFLANSSAWNLLCSISCFVFDDWFWSWRQTSCWTLSMTMLEQKRQGPGPSYWLCGANIKRLIFMIEKRHKERERNIIQNVIQLIPIWRDDLHYVLHTKWFFHLTNQLENKFLKKNPPKRNKLTKKRKLSLRQRVKYLSKNKKKKRFDKREMHTWKTIS